MAGDIGSIFGDIGGAVSDIFKGIGEGQSADSYTKAAGIADENARLERDSTAIQEAKLSRTVYGTISGQQADVAGAGFGAGGSAGDLLRDSAEQGGLAKQLVDTQGAINVNGYLQQATAYRAEATAANTASTGGFIGGLIKGVSAVAGIASFFL